MSQIQREIQARTSQSHQLLQVNFLFQPFQKTLQKICIICILHGKWRAFTDLADEFQEFSKEQGKEKHAPTIHVRAFVGAVILVLLVVIGLSLSNFVINAHCCFQVASKD